MPVKDYAERVSLSPAEAHPVRSRSRRKVSLPTGAVRREVSVLESNAHIISQPDAEARERLIGENHIHITAMHVCAVQANMVG